MVYMKQSSIVVIDLGGTKINVGLYRSGKIAYQCIKPFDAQLSVSESIQFILQEINDVKAQDTVAIAIGVPSIVDVEHGIVYNAINIKAWQKVALKKELEQLTQLPVYVNNDVNCFTKGEHSAHSEQGFQNVVGLCLGTGLGAGFVIKDQLYTGTNCCAGELGGVQYLNATFDSYCSGQFFIENFGECGAELAKKANEGDNKAKVAFELFGQHLASAISHLLLIIDPQIIILGGSVAKSYDLFIDSLWLHLQSFPYPNVIKNLIIEQSQQHHSALLGAAQLYLDSQEQQACFAS
ncbi:ROK family protein [Litorilituus lipolyticus]|uniref:ROK family protein n=2 Tax=Litorilituus lipolyticus TaxID=2491017 RepID=A0A502KVW4_9GAMM|nr:ROK family protein [Litorilituus lipolyticus]